MREWGMEMSSSPLPLHLPRDGETVAGSREIENLHGQTILLNFYTRNGLSNNKYNIITNQ